MRIREHLFLDSIDILELKKSILMVLGLIVSESIGRD